jgi:hypothetical protein
MLSRKSQDLALGGRNSKNDVSLLFSRPGRFLLSPVNLFFFFAQFA